MTPIERPVTADRLFLWVMHRFAEVFEEHAILKGGMALRLLDSPRSTTDIDYLFVPFASKKDIFEPIKNALRALDGAEVITSLHSKMLRAELRLDGVGIQIEVSVARQCATQAMATGGYARSLGRPSRVVRMMAVDVAFAHKIAAWNERRLLRDLYDCYFFGSRLAAQPDLEVLAARLSHVASRLPALRGRKKLSLAELATELRAALRALSEAAIREELGPLLPSEERAGLLLRLRAGLNGLAEGLEAER